MAKLAFYLMGLPRLERDGALVKINRRRALAFAIYLALTGRTFSREALAAFFWTEQDERSARTDLRRTLHELNRLLGLGWLRVEEDAIQFQAQPSLWIDVVEFRRLLAVCGKHGHAAEAVCPQCLPLLAQAVALYQDDFLAGFSLFDSPAFDDWQFFEGEQLRDEFASALDRLVQAYTKQANYGQAIVVARRRLALDPLYEPAQRQLIQLYAWHEQPANALRQYEQCVQVLAKELSVPPEPATTELYQAIKAHRLSIPSPDPAWQTAVSPAPSASTVEWPEGETRIVTLVRIGLDEGDHASNATSAQNRLALITQAGLPYAAQVTLLPDGDLLVLFGVAQAHEDDAERAVRMAVAVQQAAQAQGISLQIGISRGPAYCQRSATNAAAPVIGSLVTQAMRLRNHAGAQQIWVDKGIYQTTRGLCAYQAVDLHAPGLPTAYQVRQLYSHAGKLRGLEGLRAELVGRQEEMTKLHAALTQAQQGDGQIVAIVGNAGVGKSRLVEELKLMVDSVWQGAGSKGQGAGSKGQEEGSKDNAVGHSALRTPHSALLWLEGRALEFASTTSYWLFADLLRGFWGAPADEHDQRLAQNLLNTLQRLQDAGHLTAADLDEMGPLLGQLLAVRFGTSWDERLQHVDPNQLQQRTFAAMQTLVGALARVQPLVLVFEDLHWADALSVDLISALLEKLATLPLLLLCVYRPEAAQADNHLANVALHRCPERFTELRVRELTSQQSRQLVASLLAIEALPTGLRETILTKAQGNPFFLEEIVRVLIDNGQIYRAGATWQASATLDNFTVPDTLEGIILSRMDQLPNAMRQVLQRAAVLGRLFCPAVLAQMALPLADLEPVLRGLVEKSFIYLERMLPEAEYSFHHVLVRDAVYQALLQPQRRALHRRAGEVLETHYADNLAPYVEALAYHYDEADEATKAIPYLLQAGEKARRTYLNEAASIYFQRALQRLVQLPATSQTQAQHLAAFTGLGQLAAVMSQFAAAEQHLRQAILLSQALQASAKSEARLRAWLGDLLLNWQPRPAEALMLAEAGLAGLGNDDESTEAAMLYGVIGWAHDGLGDLTGFRATVARVARFLADVPYAEELRPTYGLVTMAYLRNKELEKALIWMENTQRQALQHHDLRWYGESIYAIAQIMLGRPLSNVLALLEEARTLLDQVGDRKRANWVVADSGVLLFLHGFPSQAQPYLEQAVQDAQAVNQEHLADLMRWLGEIYLAQGAFAKAIVMLEQALIQYPALAINPAEGLVALAYTWLAGDQRESASGSFEAALVAMGGPAFTIDFRNYRTRTRSLFANALCGLEEALADSAAFQAFCVAFRAARPALVTSPFTQWHLTPAQPSPITASNAMVTTFATGVGAPWQWRDPVGNAIVSTAAGLRIETPNVRELWDAFLTAPCLLQPVAGDWLAQVVCHRPLPDRPAIGGLLLWQDKWHFLRLDWGTRGQAEVALQGCVNRQEVVIGRGRLPGAQIYLRLERTGNHMGGFCSSDGETWFSVGAVEFAVTAPVQIGLFTASYIERLIEPDAFAEGTAICFERFVLGKPTCFV